MKYVANIEVQSDAGFYARAIAVANSARPRGFRSLPICKFSTIIIELLSCVVWQIPRGISGAVHSFWLERKCRKSGGRHSNGVPERRRFEWVYSLGHIPIALPAYIWLCYYCTYTPHTRCVSGALLAYLGTSFLQSSRTRLFTTKLLELLQRLRYYNRSRFARVYDTCPSVVNRYAYTSTR